MLKHTMGMPNIASVLKEEITRLARKEIRGDIADLRKALATQRSDIAELKRKNRELEQTVRRLQKASGTAPPAPSAGPKPEASGLRFSAKGLATHRKRLGLSVADVGLLVGASDQSVYLWEAGTVRPRAKHLPAIAALRTLGKREAAARLAEIKPAR